MESSQSVYLVFIILALIYGILDFFAIIRTAKLHRFTSEWRHAKIFYISMILQASFRIAGFVVIVAYLEDRRTTLTFLMTAIPDSLFILNFLLIFWQMISVFRYAHFDHHLEVSLVTALSKETDKSLASRLFQGGMVVWCMLQCALFFSFAFNKVTDSAIDWEMGVVNIFLALLAAGSYCYLSRMYSGSPVKSRFWHKRLKRMNYTAMIWSLCRIARGVIDVIDAATNLSLRGDTTQLIAVIIIIAALIISEILCYFLVLDYAFISIFVLTDGEAATQKSFETNDSDAVAGLPMQNTEVYVRRFPALYPEFRIKSDDLAVSASPPERTSRHKLGKIHQGWLRQHQVAVRVIPFDHISGYMMDEFLSEIEALWKLDVPHFVPMYGAVLDLPCIKVVMPWLERGSLFTYLHTQPSNRLSERKIRRIALDISLCMRALHSLGRSHGHLTSHNILLDTDLSAYVTDIGLNKLKEFAGLSLGYVNKSAWTSPEVLMERFNTVMKASPEDDIYSFGVVLWEMTTGIEPFKEYSRKELVREVGEKHIRPEIPTDIPRDLATLIHNCWNPDRAQRPSFPTIIDLLETSEAIN